jgi:hypothetical protein
MPLSLPNIWPKLATAAYSGSAGPLVYTAFLGLGTIPLAWMMCRTLACSTYVPTASAVSMSSCLVWALVVQVEGMELVIEDMVGATGLELKSDPGVPFVYAGFAGMMVRLCFWGYQSCRACCDDAPG